MNQEAIANQINAIISKCWTDDSFKQKLLKNSTETLKAEGIDIPLGCTVRILENTGKTIHFVLPPNPNAELSDAELETVAGGSAASRVETQIRNAKANYELQFPNKKL